MRDSWSRFTRYFLECPDTGVAVDVSRCGFPEGYFDLMVRPMTHALEEMRELEAGAIANPDERRMVGHYWLRAPERAPSDDIRSAIQRTIQRIEQFAEAVHRGEITSRTGRRFEHVLLVGIGGSALGPQLVADALGHARDPMRLHFIDNTDPDGMDRVFETLQRDLGATLVLVISKSGGTIETRNGMQETAYRFQRAGLHFPAHAVAVTGEGSALHQQARREQWLDIFPMWDWVGGRTSVTGPVGLLPAALQGVDIRAFLEGARAMDQATRAHGVRNNPAGLLSATWYHCTGGAGAKDMVILPYKDRLVLFSRYLQQLVMESLGKGVDRRGRPVRQGITVFGNKGSTDQHAYVQQLREGVNNFFVTFIHVLQDYTETPDRAPGDEALPRAGDYLTGFLLGTRDALSEAGRESITVTLHRVDARTLGALIALFERAVGLYASLVDINAYHQPGVEAGKRAASQVIDLQNALTRLFQAGAMGTAEQLAVAANLPDRAETAFHVLEHLCANGRACVVVEGAPAEKVYGPAKACCQNSWE